MSEQPLSRSIAEEIDLELSNQFPHAHDWSEAQLQAAAEVIQRRVWALVKALDQIRTARNGCQECDEFEIGCICLKCETKRALSKL